MDIKTADLLDFTGVPYDKKLGELAIEESIETVRSTTMESLPDIRDRLTRRRDAIAHVVVDDIDHLATRLDTLEQNPDVAKTLRSLYATAYSGKPWTVVTLTNALGALTDPVRAMPLVRHAAEMVDKDVEALIHAQQRVEMLNKTLR